MTFRDHFSSQAPEYARSRPGYPPALFAALAALAPARTCAWDAGTGSGQAAIGLAAHFERVLATDASAAQVGEAAPHPRIEYRTADAADSGLPASGADLVTAAQAAHWFDLPAFYAEARRVLRPSGVLALWCYGVPRVTTEVDARVDRFYHDVVGPYWPPERRHVESGYASLPFPFPERPFPAVAMERSWGLTRFLAYVGTWSAVLRYRQARGEDPLVALAADLADAWPAASPPRRIRWPLTGRLGHHP